MKVRNWSTAAATGALVLGLLGTGAPARADAPAARAALGATAEAQTLQHRTYFRETYRGRRIEGWTGRQPCAWIDGRLLAVSRLDDGSYVTALTAYEPLRGLRAATRRAVENLGDAELTGPTGDATCRRG